MTEDKRADAVDSPEQTPDEAPQPIDVSQLSYEEYLKLSNPEKPEAEIKRMIRKENRYVWIGRVQIVLLALIAILVVYFIVTK